MYYLLTFGVLICWVTVIVANDCDKLGILFYEDLGCLPHYPNNASHCPEKYHCSGLNPSTKNCFFRGKSYIEGEEVDDTLSLQSCHIGCSCDRKSDKLKFVCAILDCPEEMNPDFIPPGCYGTYSRDDCCATGQICPPFDNITKCEFGGETYREGEEFWPANTCWKCVCNKNFTNKLEAPSCRRQSCGIQIHRGIDFVHRKCAPIYTSEVVHCCPRQYACPNGNEKIEGTAVSDKLICKFGNKEVKKGQFIETTSITDLYSPSFKKVKCECVVPPFLKCHPI